MVALLLVSAGCSGGNGNGANQTNQPKEADQQQEANKTSNKTNKTKSGEEAQKPAAPAEPVTITVAFPWGKEIFNSRFKPLDDKLENITIKRVDAAGTNEALQELFATGTEPDIIIGNRLMAQSEAMKK